LGQKGGSELAEGRDLVGLFFVLVEQGGIRGHELLEVKVEGTWFGMEGVAEIRVAGGSAVVDEANNFATQWVSEIAE
jgi:hypothetical protein